LSLTKKEKAYLTGQLQKTAKQPGHESRPQE